MSESEELTPLEIVHEKFNKFVKNLSFGHTQLPLSFFSYGWIAF